jgi:hypothetical protein
MMKAQVYSSFGHRRNFATCEARSALKNAFGERSLLWSLRLGNFGDSLFQGERFNVCTSQLAVTRCVWRPVHVWRPQLSPPPYESSVWSPAALVMGAGGGGGAAAAVRRIVDTVRKYKEVRSVEVR